MKTFAPDTNFFLQCKDVDQIDWFGGEPIEDVCLLIPRQVVREIDRLKGNGNDRRASRARKVSTVFREVLEAQDKILVKRVRGHSISFRFMKRGEFSNTTQPMLLDNADDRIVAEVRAYSLKHPEIELTLLTADTHMMLSAEDADVAYRQIPDIWRLPPEKSDDQKAREELTRRVAALEKAYPVLQLSLSIDSTAQPVELVYYPPLDEDQINSMVGDIKAALPIVDNFDPEKHTNDSHKGIAGYDVIRTMNAMRQQFEKPPSDADMSRYRERQYPEWIKQIESRLRSYHQKLRAEWTFEASTMVSNQGGTPALKLLLEFSVEGHLAFSKSTAASELDEDDGDLPNPPRPPKPRNVFDLMHEGRRVLGLYEHHALLLPPPNWSHPSEEPDKDSFYDDTSSGDRETAVRKTFRCDEFRHQLRSEIVPLSLVPRTNDEGVHSGILVCRAHALNMPELVTVSQPVKLHVKHGSTYGLAVNSVNDFILRASAFLRS